MALSYRELSSKNATSFERLKQEVNKMSSKTDKKKDERFWYPNVDKAGNGYAIIRFLDSPNNEDLPIVRLWNHAFKGPTGQWYIENSLTTIGKVDPVSEFNSKLWNESSDDNSPGRKQAREQKRKVTYISNVYVIKDSANPENEGKVFLYKFGKKVFDKIDQKMHPQFEDEKPTNPFNMISGACFKLKIRNVEGYRNYDLSEFDAASPLFTDDDEIDRVWKSCYLLQPFLAADQFKPYEELKAKLNKVLSGENSRDEDSNRNAKPYRAEAPPSVGRTGSAARTPTAAAVSKREDSLSFFENLANSDED